VEINPDKIDQYGDEKYTWTPFISKDVVSNTLANAREKKETKYKPITSYAESWLKRNSEEIRIKYKVQEIKVDCKFIIISNLGVVPDTTVKDVCGIISEDEKEKVRYGKMWLKRMVNQVIRGSFDCYINAGKEITELDHVSEVGQDITSIESSINLN
jgi:hypothetical protein